MTVGQALIEFLAHQWSVDGDHRARTVAGTFGIFGHGNVAGVGQALKQLSVDHPGLMPYHQARNEQAMVHQSVAYSRMRRRLGTFASTASVGPGSTNMITGAALATSNRLPALILPSDTFATRVSDPVLQSVELPYDTGLTVNDAFRPVSRYFDRVQRPEHLFSIALAAMRVLTDPVETGAVTIALPEDVQAEALDVPTEFLQDREWVLRRPLPERAALARAVAAIRSARRPLVVAGGGVIYAGAEGALARFTDATGVPVTTTQAGGGSLPWDHPHYLGGGRCHRLDCGQPARRAGRRRHRHRHPFQRLHDRQPQRLPAPGRGLRQPQRLLLRRLQARHAGAGRRRRPRGARRPR